MTSQVFVAYIIVALGAVASLTANPIAPGDSAADTTLAVSPAHLNVSPPTTAVNASATASSRTPPVAAITNNTALSSGNQEDAHFRSMPVAKGDRHGHLPFPSIPTCHDDKKSKGVETHHCERALDKLAYGANQTLDKFSSFIFVNYKTCNVNIYKPKNATLTKDEVGFMVHNVNGACHSVGGVLFKTSKIAVNVERGNAENTYEVDTPLCKKEKCPLTLGDCLSAFYQIPLDRTGGFTSRDGSHSFARVTSGNCTVTIATTDYSDFAISRPCVYPTVRKLFNACGRHPGKIYLAGGSTGFNGDIKISIRAPNLGLCE